MIKITATPSTENVRARYKAFRVVGKSYDEKGAEFDRWLAVHDQSIRDAVKPPEMTAKEHMEAAWDAAPASCVRAPGASANQTYQEVTTERKERMNQNGITPSTEAVRRRYRACRLGTSYEESGAEFDRWLAAYAQGVRNAVVRPELTAKEHMEAAWDAAHPVPKGSVIPAGTPSLSRPPHGETEYFPVGIDHDFTVREGDDVRTLEPLPPVIPDDCDAVWASTRENGSRRVWVRATGVMAGRVDVWDDGNNNADYAETSELIDPVPVPEEER